MSAQKPAARHVVSASVLERLRQSLASDGADPTATQVAGILRAEGRVLGDGAILEIVDALRRDTVGAGPLDELLHLPGVTDVIVNGPDAVFIDRGSGLERTAVRFDDEEAVRRLAQRLAASGGRRLDDASPLVDLRLRDGSRFHAVLAPLARPGTAMSLRVPARRAFTLDELVGVGTVSELGASLLRDLVTSRAAFLVTGGTRPACKQGMSQPQLAVRAAPSRLRGTDPVSERQLGLGGQGGRFGVLHGWVHALAYRPKRSPLAHSTGHACHGLRLDRHVLGAAVVGRNAHSDRLGAQRHVLWRGGGNASPHSR